MRKLNERLNRLEQSAYLPQEGKTVLIVGFMKPGEVRELKELYSSDKDFSCLRLEGETEEQFVARAELEARQVIQPGPGCAVLLYERIA